MDDVAAATGFDADTEVLQDMLENIDIQARDLRVAYYAT